ncbi:MAG: N-acetylmuramoyl-L-alanine amidase [bacterium]|nr:N-acetylmuramoyl-L-alanine amidase [bacterium]
MKRLISLALIASLTIVLSSCATTPVKPYITPVKEIYPQTTISVLRQDTSHIVAPGETLWRVSKMYNVPIKDILSVNNLKTQTLEKGQHLLVPNAAPIIPVISLYPSRKWKYIIIHHSATDGGSSLSFDRYHLRRGWDSIGYHFVINNGSQGKDDGQIEVSPRWLKQKNGAHCNAGNMNERSIGICLVGDFNKERVSEKQMASLAYLVNILRKYYKIPKNNIMGHGQVSGAKTECPGKYFPWREFYNKLN